MFFSFRYAASATRYEAEVRMHMEMGMNLIRVWGGGITERPELYLAADRLGMLVMQEFWMTGDNNGRWCAFAYKATSFCMHDGTSNNHSSPTSISKECRIHPNTC